MNDSAHVIPGIDHLIVAVRDLDRSRARWEALGFNLTPRGFHQTGGTANHLILLEETYIELLGVVDSSAKSPFRAYLELAPGLCGMAFRASADAAFEYWKAQSLFVAPPASLARDVEVQGRSEVARFRLSMLEAAPELPLLLFCCEQLTREFVWQPGRRAQANGAQRLKELVFLVEDPRAQAHFERIVGRTATGTSGSSALELGGVHIAFHSKEQLIQRFGVGADFRSAPLPMLAGFALETDALEGARALAVNAGYTVHEAAEGGFVAPVPDEGVFIAWR